MKKFICDIKKTRKHSRCKSHNGYASWLALICFALLLQIISLMSIYVLNSAYLIQANRQSIVDLSCISHAKMMIENNNLVRRCNYAVDQLILKKIEEINGHIVIFIDENTYISCQYEDLELKVFYDEKGISGIDYLAKI